MRKIFFSLILLALQELFAQSPYHYQVEKVMEDVYVLKPQMNNYRWVTANIVVIINEKDVLVVDSGLLPEAGREAIREINKLTSKPVKYLFNTHWHGDHWQGNEAFVKSYPDLKIIASKEGAEGIARDGMLWVKKHYIRNFQRMIDGYEERLRKGDRSNGTKLTSDEMKELAEGIEMVKSDLEEMKQLRPVFPSLTFERTMTLQSGGREIQFHYLGKGNTRGDAVIYLPNERLLITGDLVVHPSPYESGTFSLDWIETSRKLAGFDYSLLIPGHGEVQHDTSYLDFLNALFAEIVKQVNQAYLEGSYQLEEFQKLVNHESVTQALQSDHRFVEHIKNLSPGFIPACVERIHKRAHDGRLTP